MDMTNKPESWFSRNDWAKPLASGVMLILAALLLSTILAGSGQTVPGWMQATGVVGGVFGLFMAALKARLTDTVSARVFCCVIVAFSLALAIWQLVEILKH